MRLYEFAQSPKDDGDNRSKLIGTIARLLKAGNRVDFFVPGIRGHVAGVSGDGTYVILKRWKKPYSKVSFSLQLDATDDERFGIKIVSPDYYQVVEREESDQQQMDEVNNPLNEFAPDEGGGSRKFIPWPEFIEQVKQLVGKDFEVVEKVVKSTIQDRFVPYDPMEYGPTMLYSYYEARAGRGKGAVSTRGSIQVGKYVPNSSQLGTRNFITTFNLLKGHKFERHFDLTFDNVYEIANIIKGNTQGAYQVQPQAQQK